MSYKLFSPCGGQPPITNKIHKLPITKHKHKINVKKKC